MTDLGISVSGGANGIDAKFDDIRQLGDLYGSIGPTLVGYAWDDKLEAADGDLLASAILSPGTFAEAEGAIVEATYGPHGLAVKAAVIEGQAICFVAVVEFYEDADEAIHQAFEALSYGVGFAAGFVLPGAVIAGGVGLVGLALTNPLALAGLGLGLTAYTSRDELIAFLEDNPWVIQTLANGGGGLLDGLGTNPITSPLMQLLGLGGFHADTASAADDLGELLFTDYEGELNPDYDGALFAHDAPRDFSDLMEDLNAVATGTQNGVFTVQTLTDEDGEVRHIVQLPGTDDFLSDTEIRNMGSNLNLIAGDQTAYAQAVQQAMAQAGVRPGEPVMLVGHSQGGMQAAALAADPTFPYQVTHVVTAGSPVATSGIPDDVTVVSLENTGDVVPLLDGENNPGTANHITVTADLHSGSFGAAPGQNHSMSTYETMANAVDDSDDPSLTHAIESMQEAGYLTENGELPASQTHTYQAQVGQVVRPSDIPR